MCRRLTGEFLRCGEECRGYVPETYMEEGENLNFIFPVTDSVGRWTQKQFGQADGLIYIGAAGIAVRAIAPYLKDKMTDPAVVVIDDQSRYAVSLLSGHVGGANALAEEAAQILGAVPVITTASDVRGLTAVDVWARRRGLLISDRILAKETAAALVNGEEVGFFSDYPLEDGVPEGYVSGKNLSEKCMGNLPFGRKYSGSGGGFAGGLQIFTTDSSFSVCGNRMQKIHI